MCNLPVGEQRLLLPDDTELTDSSKTLVEAGVKNQSLIRLNKSTACVDHSPETADERCADVSDDRLSVTALSASSALSAAASRRLRRRQNPCEIS